MVYFLINDRTHNAFFLFLSNYIAIWKIIFDLNSISCVIIYLLISFEYHISFLIPFYLLYFASGVSLLNTYSCFVFLKIVIFTRWIEQFIFLCVMTADVFEFIYTVFKFLIIHFLGLAFYSLSYFISLSIYLS